MPIEWLDGSGSLRWEDGANLLWENEPIPGPIVVYPLPQPSIRRPGRFIRRVQQATTVPVLPSLSNRAAPTTAEYRIEIRNRVTGQINPLCLFVEGLITAGFTRVLDDISEAFVTVTSPDDSGCADCSVAQWVDELVFYRDANPEPVWIGPIVGVSDSGTELTLRAVDRLGNIGDRRAPISHPAFARREPTVDPHDLALWLLTAAEQQGALGLTLVDPPYDTRPQLVTARITAGDLLFDELSNLADDHIDFTVAGPRLFFGAPTITLPELPRLDTRLHWQEDGATIDIDGRALASQIEVIGGGDTRAVYPTVLPDGYLVRPQRLVREDITNVELLQAVARDAYAISSEPTVTVLTEPSLDASAPLAVEDLIPGRTVTVHHRRSRREVFAQQRLVALEVTIDSVVDGRRTWVLGETAVQIELEPALRRIEGDS